MFWHCTSIYNLYNVLLFLPSLDHFVLNVHPFTDWCSLFLLTDFQFPTQWIPFCILHHHNLTQFVLSHNDCSDFALIVWIYYHVYEWFVNRDYRQFVITIILTKINWTVFCITSSLILNSFTKYLTLVIILLMIFVQEKAIICNDSNHFFISVGTFFLQAIATM